jgi:hypothetical protein
VKSRARKALGCAILPIYLAVYAVLAASLGSALTPPLPAWGELSYYAIAGLVWIAPLKPLFAWLNRGS